MMAIHRAVSWLLCACATALGSTALAAQQLPSVAFYYAEDPPVEQLDQFDWVVVEADHLDRERLTRLGRNGAEVFAYLSVGELETWRDAAPPILPPSARHGRNPDWGGQLVDLTDRAWQDYLIDQRAAELWQQGYRGLFLDTLDSYRRFTDEGTASAQQDALVSIIARLRLRYPGIKLLLNRGFEVLERVQGQVVGVAAESLYRGWTPATDVFGGVSEKDTTWLTTRLAEARDRFGLVAIAIDYVPAMQRDLARQTARRIFEQGFVPWVSVPALDQIGVGLIEPVPRRMLVFYDQRHAEDRELANTNAFRYLGVILEYLGYAVEYRDVGARLPEGLIHGRYAGIVTWFDQPIVADEFVPWLTRQVRSGSRVAMFGTPGVPLTGALGRLTGLREQSSLDSASLAVKQHDALIGYEGMPSRQEFFQGGFHSHSPSNTRHLVLADDKGANLSPIVTGPWGGIALTPWVLQGGAGQQRWILDPFAFLTRSLALNPFPVPDATTENGSRFWLTHIDGDAFISHAEFPGAPFTGEVMLDEILERYRIPTTVSVVEGEFGPQGVRSEDGPVLEPLAQRIFALPWVEPGTHTFSHPFIWHRLSEGDLAGQGRTAAGFAFNLPIDAYRYSLEREIGGSADYINRCLAPADKPVRIVQWSGDALPPQEALAVASRLGLANINGGNTRITRDNPSLTQISPMLRPLGPYLQVIAPQINENVYTNEMTSPLWGYRRVIETFELTDLPRRFKPMNIYYHFYSAANPGALRALKQVYDYALTQDTVPVYTSTWSTIATQWYDTGVARHLDGSWRISGADQNRTLRLPERLGWPDMRGSRGVAGVRETPSGRYVALSGDSRVRLELSPEPPRFPYLLRSNGRLSDWRQVSMQRVTMTLRAEQVALEVDLGASDGCRVTAPGASRQALSGGGLGLRYAGPGPATIEVSCD